jgi:hypothetical protein
MAAATEAVPATVAGAAAPAPAPPAADAAVVAVVSAASDSDAAAKPAAAPGEAALGGKKKSVHRHYEIAADGTVVLPRTQYVRVGQRRRGEGEGTKYRNRDHHLSWPANAALDPEAATANGSPQ